MIYIATHKEFAVPAFDGYMPIQVGAAFHEPLPYLHDDDGSDNISSRNANYCELTALYWIWRNSSEEYKGLVHYRRYFGKSNLSASLSDIYSYEQMVRLLGNADIVLPYVEHLLQTAKEELLIRCCTPVIFEQLRACVEEVQPDYLESFDKTFASNRLTFFNMMFCRRELFDEYCQFLFSILFRLEGRVDMTSLNDYQKRLYGFLSERLLNVWVSNHKLKVCHTAVINTESPLRMRLQFVRRRITNELRFRLQNFFRA